MEHSSDPHPAVEGPVADSFWTSQPDRRGEVAVVEVDGQLVVWGDHAAPTAMPLVATALWPFLDGETSLADLAEDVAAAGEIGLNVARRAVAETITHLARLGAVDQLPSKVDSGEIEGVGAGVDAAPSAPAGDEERWVDPVTGDIIRVERTLSPEGHPTTIEHLADGRRRISTTMSFGSGGSRTERELVEGVRSGDRSPAELVPLDSCVGSKLRNVDHVDLVTIKGPDGQLRSVRCHDAEVSALLRQLPGAQGSNEEGRGPIEAFVVTPLEGTGPRRIYDGYGIRRGRPRSAAEAAATVDQILGERVAVEEGDQEDGVVAINAFLAHDAAGPILVPAEPDLVVELLRRDEVLRPASWGAAVLAPDGATVTVPGVNGGEAVAATALRIHSTLRRQVRAELAASLVQTRAASSPASRRHHLEAIAALLGRAQV